MTFENREAGALAPVDGLRAQRSSSASTPQTAAPFNLLKMARSHFKTLLTLAFVGVLLGFLAGIPKTPLYRASTSLELLSMNQDFMNMKQTSPFNVADSSYETSELQTQVRILTSNSIIQRAVDKVSPSDFATSQVPPPAFSSLRQALHLSKPSREDLIESAVRSIRVSALGRTRLLEISVDSANPQLAADLANALASEYIAQTISTRWKATESTNVWLGRELADTRAKLARSEDALQAYATKSGLIFTSPDANIVTEKLQQIQQQLSAVTADRIDKQSRNELALASAPESLPEVISDPGLRDLGAKITDLKRQIANLGATYTTEFGKAKRLKAELEALEAEFLAERTAILTRLRNEYQEAARREQLLRTDYEAQTRQVMGQGEKSIQYNILKHEADSNRQLYDTMLQQLKQSSIISAVQASNVRILDPAIAAKRPFSPDFKTNTAVGLVAGLLFGVVFLMAKQRNHRILAEPGDVRFWTSLPELGAIPNNTSYIRASTYRKQSTGDSGIKPPREVTSLPHLTDDLPGTSSSSALRYQPVVLADAFRSVSASILFSDEEGARPKTLVLTSASPEDGKTTVIVNLGIGMAETHNRVLIIDADLRGPTLHRIFDLPNDRGLTDLLRQQDISADALSAHVRESGVPGLHILVSGTPTQSPAQLLHSPTFRALLARCREQYDVTLIDTPPMLHMPDARIVGKVADAVILVARAEKTTPDVLIAARERFSDDGVRVLGTILNRWDLRKSQRSSYKSYGSQLEDTYRRYASVPNHEEGLSRPVSPLAK